jgi:RHS repeat-associated protein
VQYTYDYLGRRTSKIMGQSTTTYLYDGQNLIGERGATTVDYVHGPGIDEPLARKGTEVAYYAVDGLGSVWKVYDPTVQGGGNDYTYDAWGVVRAQSGSIQNRFTYTARESAEAGLMYYRARYYSPPTGRFISEDTGLQFGPSLYAYVLNDPAKLRDPSGHYAIVNNLSERTIPAWQIPSRCPANSLACTRVSYAYVACDCEPKTCPEYPIYAQVTFVFGGTMWLPAGHAAKARRHEYGCHVDPAISAITPLLSEIESEPFWSKEVCLATCQAKGQGAVNKFLEELERTQANESACPFKVY